jgi:integrase
MLTAAAKYDCHPLGGGGDMKGSYHWHSPAKRFYVSVYYDGKRYKVWKYNDLPILHEKIAEKLVNKIRAEKDDGTFDIRSYLPNSPLNIKAYSEIWLKASPSCANTKRVHRSAINKAVAMIGDIDIRTITFSKLSTMQQEMTGSVKWKNSVLIALKAMLHFAIKDGVMKQMPPFPTLEAFQRDTVEYLTFEEQQTVLSAMPAEHRPIFMFGMECGLRIGELRALKKDCLEDGCVIIRRSFSQWNLLETTKTYRVRRLPLTARAQEILKANRTSFSEYLFTFDGMKPYYERKMREIWTAACDKVGIKINQKNAIRHSLGCQLLDTGKVDLEMVRDIYGHTSTDMTRKYVTRTPARMLEALESRGQLVAFQRNKTASETD